MRTDDVGYPDYDIHTGQQDQLSRHECARSRALPGPCRQVARSASGETVEWNEEKVLVDCYSSGGSSSWSIRPVQNRRILILMLYIYTSL